ncbi:hypothetical protein CRM22_007581 [Opisthorchis felineus]|uniref:Uncharacterized protein n=1 Tax=Opisthorchis felineus TaxID=147828 RepID=A0A4S2LF81_OPIFE|nr:hypothetical protein CRM22_007581 [Opisthorchis felineus]
MYVPFHACNVALIIKGEMKSDSVWHRIKLGVKSYWYRLQFGGSILTKYPDIKDVKVRNGESAVDMNGSELANSSICLFSMDSSAHKHRKPWITWAPISGCSWNCSRRRPSQLRTSKAANLFGKETEGFVIKKRLRRCKIVTASCMNQQAECRPINHQKHSKQTTRIFPSSSSSSSSSRKSYFPQSLYCLTAYHFCWHEFAFLVDAGFDLNRPQYLHCESTDSGSFVFRFISVLDLFLYVVEKCHLLISKGLPPANNIENFMFDMQMFNNRCAAETVVFPRLLSALLSKGADVRLTSTTSYENVVGGLPTSRMRSLSTIAAMELSSVHKTNTPVVYNPIDAAGIIRQLIKSGLQPDNITADLMGSQRSTQDNLYEKLLRKLACWNESCIDSYHSLGPSLQSYVILLLNIVYSGLFVSFHGVSLDKIHPEQYEKDERTHSLVSVYHSAFLQLTHHSPQSLFLLARRSVRQLLGTRWFQECLDQDIVKTKDASVDRPLHPYIEARQQMCQRLPENLRRSVAYLEASDVSQELEFIANIRW